jgi:hypothetical protein
MPARTLVILCAVIEPRLSTTALTTEDRYALLRNGEQIAIESRNAKLALFKHFTITECGGTSATPVLAGLFKLTRSRVRAVRARALRKQLPRYPPHAVSDEHESELCQVIRDKAVTGD